MNVEISQPEHKSKYDGLVRIVPANPNEPFFIMPRATAQDRRLSFEARGVLSYLLSRPKDWEVKPKDLEQECGRSRVYRILSELETSCYLERRPVRDKGRWHGYEYRVHATPCVEKPHTEKPYTENQHTTYKREEQNTESTEKKSLSASLNATPTHAPQADSIGGQTEPNSVPPSKSIEGHPTPVPPPHSYDNHEGEGDPVDGWSKCVVCQAFTIHPETDRCIHWEKDVEHHEAWYGDDYNPDPVEGFRQSFKDAMEGKTRPIKELWDDINKPAAAPSPTASLRAEMGKLLSERNPVAPTVAAEPTTVKPPTTVDGYGPRAALPELKHGFRYRHTLFDSSTGKHNSHIVTMKGKISLCRSTLKWAYEDFEFKSLDRSIFRACPDCQRMYAERTAPKVKPPKAEKKPSKDQVLKDAIAVNLQGIAADMATSLTGYLSAKAGGVWRKKLGRDLTAEDYTKIARSFDKSDGRGFIKWFRRKCKGCDLPLQPDTFESRYAQYVTELDKPIESEVTTNGHITDDIGDIADDDPFAKRADGK